MRSDVVRRVFGPSPEIMRSQAEWSRHRALMDELQALRAPRLMVFVDTMNLLEGYYETQDIDLADETAGEVPQIDPEKLLEQLESFPSYRLVRAYWYDAEVSKDHSCHEVQQSLHE